MSKSYCGCGRVAEKHRIGDPGCRFGKPIPREWGNTGFESVAVKYATPREFHPVAACPYCQRQYETVTGLGGHLIKNHPGEVIPTVNQYIVGDGLTRQQERRQQQKQLLKLQKQLPKLRAADNA